jgi:hypothetical protein
MIQKGRDFKLFRVTAAVVIALSPSLALAQVNLSDLSIHLVPGGNLVDILGRLVGIALLWGGILAFIFILYGGFLYLTAGGDSAKTASATKTITNAVIGIVVIALSYALVQFVINQAGSLGTNQRPSITGGTTSNAGTTTNTGTRNTNSGSGTTTNSGTTSGNTTGGTTTGSGTQAAKGPHGETLFQSSLDGKVSFPSGQGGQTGGLSIRFYPDSDPSHPYLALTNDDGTYFYTDLAAGHYKVQIDGPQIDANSFWCADYETDLNGKWLYKKTSTFTKCLTNKSNGIDPRNAA